MEIKNNLMRSVGILIFFLLSCSGPKPGNDKIIGTWMSHDGAQFLFKANGGFMAKSLPCSLFWGSFATCKTFSGSGSWKITKGQSNWEIDLDFTENDSQSIKLYGSLLLSKDGDWGTGRNLYIFKWVGEEGGERYQFYKK